LVLTIVGCSDDTTSAPSIDASAETTAPGADAGTDATASWLDSSSDTTLQDVATDTPMTAEAGTDQTTLDAGNDAGGDTGNDAGLSCSVPDAAGLDAASVEAGFYAVWQVYKCYSCHQRKSSAVDSLGNGIVLSGNNDGLGDSGTIFPPNLTSDPETGLGCWSDGQIVDAILHGSTPDGGQLCPSMPLWGNPLATVPPDGGIRPGTPMDAGTAQAIVDFIRSLPAVTNVVPDTTCALVPDAGPGDAGNDGRGDAADADGQDAADAAVGASDAGSQDAAVDVIDSAVDATDASADSLAEGASDAAVDGDGA
jgi:hypothetical protein